VAWHSWVCGEPEGSERSREAMVWSPVPSDCAMAVHVCLTAPDEAGLASLQKVVDSLRVVHKDGRGVGFADYSAEMTLIASIAVALLAWAWVTVVAFRTSRRWGLVALFVPMGALGFIARNRRRAWGPAILLGAALILCGAAFLIGRSVSERRSNNLMTRCLMIPWKIWYMEK